MKNAVLICAVTSIVFSACSRAPISRRDPIPPEANFVVDSLRFGAHGRDFSLLVLGAKINEESYEILQIAGDSVIISFHSNTPPYRPTVNADSIAFGGNSFVVTDSANVYRVNSVTQYLPPYGIYVFSDGEYIGRLR